MKKNKWFIKITDNAAFQNKAMICENDRTLQHAYDHISFQWASVTVFLKNTHVLTKGVFYNNKQVAIEFIKKGLIAYRDQLEIRDESICPHDRVARFLMAVIKAAKTTCDFIVTDNNTGETWDILNDTPLTIWKLNRQDLSIAQNNLNNNDIAVTIYKKIVPMNIKRSMRRHEHEHAILAS